METLYPFKFTPLYKDKIWGGQKIKNVLNQNTGNLPNCGEAWLISGIEGNATVVSNGPMAGNELNELVEVFMGDLIGDDVYDLFGDQFPLLIKILDSNDWLSVQVHPNDTLARKRKIGNGKSEMWYVMQADKNAELISGVNKEMNIETFFETIENGKLKEVLNYEKVEQGDVFDIPAGRIHALGPGCLIAEIQQTSDTTYRIYDWDRIDQSGMKRELHLDEAREAIDLKQHKNYKTAYKQLSNKTVPLITSEHFTTNFLEFDQDIRKNYSEIDSFVILLCTEGNFTLNWQNGTVDIQTGECVLIPSIIEEVKLLTKQKSKLLEVYIIPQMQP